MLFSGDTTGERTREDTPDDSITRLKRLQSDSHSDTEHQEASSDTQVPKENSQTKQQGITELQEPSADTELQKVNSGTEPPVSSSVVTLQAHQTRETEHLSLSVQESLDYMDTGDVSQVNSGKVTLPEVVATDMRSQAESEPHGEVVTDTATGRELPTPLRTAKHTTDTPDVHNVPETRAVTSGDRPRQADDGAQVVKHSSSHEPDEGAVGARSQQADDNVAVSYSIHESDERTVGSSPQPVDEGAVGYSSPQHQEPSDASLASQRARAEHDKRVCQLLTR